MIGFKIGNLFGIEIRLHSSLLLIFGLILVSLGLGVLPAWHPQWSAALTWGVATGAAVLFFVSILLHELGHALVGRTQGIPTTDITLFLFGGMANAEREAPSPRAEFLMAAAGPAVSVALGVGFTALAVWLADGAAAAQLDDPASFIAQLGPLATMFAWLGPINLLLAAFNMLPGYPLDGGRVLRAILWAATGDMVRATRWASWAGRVMGWSLVAIGAAMLLGVYIPLLGTGFIAGIWLMFIGWFLSRIAAASYQQVLVQRTLEEVSVARLMTRDPVTVPPGTSVTELVDDYVLRSEQYSFPVLDAQGRLLGVVSLDDVRRLARGAWDNTPVASIMTPLEALLVEHPDTDASAAMRDLTRKQMRELPVVEDGQLRGIIERDHLMRWIDLHMQEQRGSRH